MRENEPVTNREQDLSSEKLDERLSEPTERLIELMRRLDGDLIILGVAGKMGVTLALAARRACDEAGDSKRVIGVSRFSDERARKTLEDRGVETVACDLLDARAVAALPNTENVVFMAGKKFGTEGAPAETWAANVVVPMNVASHFTASRVVAFSTGCVYALTVPDSGGSTEDDPPDPVGEYAQSCLGRERVFEHFSARNGQPLVLFRLNYAIDLRYGVLHDIARSIQRGEEVNLSVGYFNCISQREANEWALLALEHGLIGGRTLNVTGAEIHSVREVAEALGQRMNREVRFSGEPGRRCYLSNTRLARELFGEPTTSIEELVESTAWWVSNGGESLGKPTHFEVSDGKF